MISSKLTRSRVVDAISLKTGFKKSTVQQIIERFFMEIQSTLIEDRIVEFRGFGSFQAKIRKGRTNARNPRTGEIVHIDEHKVIVFRPGQALKDAVWTIKQ